MTTGVRALERMQRTRFFDVEDLDLALAELDRFHTAIEACDL